MTNANAAAKSTKAAIAVFTRPGAPVAALMFLNTSQHPQAPVFGGTIDKTRVSAFLHQAAGKPPFLSFIDGNKEQIATGNVVVRADGIPLVVVKMGKKGEVKKTAWFNVSKNVSDDMLVSMGAKVGKLHVKTAKAPKEAVPA